MSDAPQVSLTLLLNLLFHNATTFTRTEPMIYTSLSPVHPKRDVCQFFDVHGYKQSHMTQAP